MLLQSEELYSILGEEGIVFNYCRVRRCSHILYDKEL